MLLRTARKHKYNNFQKRDLYYFMFIDVHTWYESMSIYSENKNIFRNFQDVWKKNYLLNTIGLQYVVRCLILGFEIAINM